MSEEWMAVILAGGVGSRLFPLTKEKPKPLVPIANRPMIDYAIQLLIDYGITKIVIAVKYLGDQIRAWISEQVFDGVEIIIPKIDSKDTADAVRKCSNYIDRNFIVTMADIVTNINLHDAIKFHKNYNPMATICLKPVELPGQFGLTMIDNESKIHLFLEKPTPQELYFSTLTFTGKDAILYMHHNLANIGIYLLDHAIIDILHAYGDLMDWGSHVFPFLLDQNEDVRGYLSDPYWMDAGTIGKYIWANNDVAKKWSYPYTPLEAEIGKHRWIGQNVSIAESTDINPPVIIGENTSIGDNCSIGPNVTIGEGVSIGNNVTVMESVVQDNCIIEDGVSVKHSVLSNQAKISENLILTKQVIPKQTTLKRIEDKYTWK